MEPNPNPQRMVLIVDEHANGELTVQRYGDNLLHQLRTSLIEEIARAMKEDRTQFQDTH